VLVDMYYRLYFVHKNTLLYLIMLIISLLCLLLAYYGRFFF